MAFIQISSSNPEFSFFIKKNPSSPMQIKPLRKGTVFGYYSKNNTKEYNIFFRDNGDDSSFGDEFSYLNTAQFSSAEFILNALSLFLSHNLKKQDEKDTDGFSHSIMINCLEVRSLDFVEYLKKYFDEISFSYEEINHKHIKLTLTSEKSLHHLLNNLALIVVFNLFNRFEYIEESLLEKYVNCIKVIDAPYFIRYLFKRFLPNKKFKLLKETLEDSKKAEISLTSGNNMDTRKRFVSNNLSFTRPIVDLGCGDGAYLPLSKKVSQYIAIDKDPTELEKSKLKAQRKEFDNIKFLTSLKDLKVDEPFDLIFIEVMEHMPMKEAKSIITEILKLKNLKTLLITTPNSSFNKNYAIEGFRHDDHDFELNEKEFKKFCETHFSEFEYKIVDIGDKVDGVAPTQGVVLCK